jgi:hypothetical protein
MHSAVPEGASLGTAGGLPCLGAGTGKSGPVVAEDGTARWLERRTTQSTALVVKRPIEDKAMTYASPPLTLRGGNISWATTTTISPCQSGQGVTRAEARDPGVT